MEKRIFDVLLASLSLVLLFPLMILIAMGIKLTSREGSVLHWSKRIGQGNKVFVMPKFRTMQPNTPQLATHLMGQESMNFIFPFGALLRKLSLDELPQLYSILRGEMSFVGPRPALYNQYDLMEMRTRSGVHQLLPGLTGLAQVRGRDELPMEEKVKFDEEYLKQRSFLLDIKIILETFSVALQGK